jgi:hypothetical protein
VTPDLAAFSDWALTLLPRLFLYPGGLFLLVALMLLRVASGGVGALTPRAALRDFARTDTLSLALVWAAVALLPLPSWSLPFEPEVPALALLLALSLLLDITGNGSREQALAGGAITLAVLVPAVGFAAGALVWAVVGLAVLAGVYALAAAQEGGLAGQARAIGWLWAWLSTGLPFLSFEQRWLALVLLPAAALVVGLALRAARGKRMPGVAAASAIAWFLALLSLLATLLLAP